MHPASLPLFWLLLFASPAFCKGAEDAVPNSILREKSISELSDPNASVLGRRALSIRPKEWKHSETKDFIYHYFSSAIAQPVAVEAEYYYRTISREMEKDTSQWERKCHIYIFELQEDWDQFKVIGGLEPWTGGLHSGSDLFIIRDVHRKWKGNTLAHEVTHLIAHRFFGSGIPLWLDEGLAEYAASRWYASFWRSRGYSARPTSVSVPSASYLPLSTLTSALSYPEKPEDVTIFYLESERLVRFLSAADKHGFNVLFEAMSQGNRFETALEKGFSKKFFNVEALEKEFKPYASKDAVEPPN